MEKKHKHLPPILSSSGHLPHEGSYWLSKVLFLCPIATTLHLDSK